MQKCTGRKLVIRTVAGCSDVMRGAVVAYHNEVKINLLVVQDATLEAFGAVSETVVREMVCGAAHLLGAECVVATSGIAGPGGGTVDKPVGTVWVALKIKDDVTATLLQLHDEGREENIKNTVVKVLEMAIGKLELY